MSCDEFGIKFYHEIDHIIYYIYHGNDEDVATIKIQEHLSNLNINIEPKDIVFYWDELF